MIPGSEWRGEAACKDMDTSIFVGDREDGSGWHPAPALTICEECPVDQECLEYALEYRIDNGVWGGLTPSQRRAYRLRWRKGAAS